MPHMTMLTTGELLAIYRQIGADLDNLPAEAWTPAVSVEASRLLAERREVRTELERRHVALSN